MGSPPAGPQGRHQHRRPGAGPGGHIGTVEEGKLADLLIVNGDPLEEPGLLTSTSRIWLVLQLGVPVAGQALEREVGCAGHGAP